MNMFLIYAMTVMITCILMLIALTMRAYKGGPNGTISHSEVSFVMMATIACLVPGLNLLTSICYLYRVTKM